MKHGSASADVWFGLLVPAHRWQFFLTDIDSQVLGNEKDVDPTPNAR